LISKDNILLNDENNYSSIKICDFGLSLANEYAGINSSEMCGTLIYMAPEFFTTKIYSKVKINFFFFYANK